MARDSGREWVTVGEIGVDAGICWLGDPCYIMHKDKNASTDSSGKSPKEIGKDWSDFCNILAQKEKVNDDTAKSGTAQFNYNMGHAGLGVVVQTGYGDGCYPVQVRRNSDGRVAEVRVVFDSDDPDDLDEDEDLSEDDDDDCGEEKDADDDSQAE